MRLSTVLLLSCAVVAMQARESFAAYTFTTIDGPGATDSRAYQINNAGQIVGDYSDSAGTHGFLDVNGVFTTIDAPGAVSTHAFGINNIGQIVGLYTTQTEVFGFVDTNGSFVSFKVPGAQYTEAYGINDSGNVSGYYTDAAGAHGFLRTGSTIATFDVPGAVAGATLGFGLNNAGVVVGYSIKSTVNGNVAQGFSDTANVFSSFGLTPTSYTVASSINTAGQIVGYYTADGTTSGGGYGFVDIGGVFTTINDPLATHAAGFGTFVYGINDTGVLVGEYRNLSGNHGFVTNAQTSGAPPTTTPVPEPAALWLLGSAMLGLALVRRRRA